MTQTTKIQIGAVTAIVALTVWLYLLPIAKRDAETKSEKPASADFKFEDVLAQTKKQYRPAQLMTINNLEKKIPGGNTDLSIYDSIGFAWDELKQPGIAAHYFEQKALKDNSERSYINAAYRYFDALRVTKGPSLGTYYTLGCLYTWLAHKPVDSVKKFGVAPDLVRLSIGIEDEAELQARMTEALEASA